MSFDAPAALPADGGSGAIPIKMERECSWTAEADVSWLSITAGRSGQGAGTVEFAATPNGDPVARNGGIVLNGTRVPVTQGAAQCGFTLASGAASFSPAGGSGGVDVRASSALCTWTAASDADWITITAGASGRGSATVSFTVAPTAGPPRTGKLTIAGQPFSVTQSEGCTYAIAPSAYQAGSSGGSTNVAVTAAPGCPWTAASTVNWVSLTTTSGAGDGVVGITVAATTGPTRSGTLTIAGHPFTVTQSPGCGFDVSPLSHATPASGGTGTISVNTTAGCAWTASSNAPWMTITAGASGNGAGTVTFTVAATTGPTRTGTLTVGGQTVTVVQSQGCTFAVSPQAHTIPAAGGTGTVAVTSGSGCAWTAASNASWITIASGASGSGAGSVTFTAAATTGPSRSGTITVAGQTVTVTQGQGCTFAISPETRSVPASGGDGTVAVSSGAGCAWNATSDASWITIASGASGSGNGTVSYKVAATTGPARTGTMTIAGRTFTVNQGPDCTISLSSSSGTQPAGGGAGAFDVRTAQGCGWTAASNAAWLSVTAGAAGDGNGTVRYAAAANTGPQRTGTISAGGQTFTVSQDAGCSFSISPLSQNASSTGGNASVGVTTAAGCAWTAASNAAWIGIASGSSGSGDGTVQLVIAANAGAERQGTVTIAGQTSTVLQAGGCSYSIAPSNHNLPSTGGSGSFSVTAGGSCAWTAAANAPWIAITSGGSGTGPGTVEFTAAANAGAARSGTITAAGQTFTLTQDAGCTFAIAPTTQAVTVAGGSGTVTVTAGAGCAWTAVSNAAWVTVTKGASGSGNETVEFTVQANATGAPRTGTITIAGHTFTIEQAGA